MPPKQQNYDHNLSEGVVKPKMKSNKASASKKGDIRWRKQLTEKYNIRNMDNYVNHKSEYNKQKTNLLARIEAIQNESDPEFLEKVGDLEEDRDFDLVRLRLSSNWRMERQRSYHEEVMDILKKQHHANVKSIEKCIWTSLEGASNKNSRENKSFLDISGTSEFTLDPTSLTHNNRRNTGLRKRENGKDQSGTDSSDENRHGSNQVQNDGPTNIEQFLDDLNRPSSEGMSNVDSNTPGPMTASRVRGAAGGSGRGPGRPSKTSKTLPGLKLNEIDADLALFKRRPSRV